MKITVLSVGKLKESFWKEAIEEYQTRLGAYAKIFLTEVSDESCSVSASEKEIQKIKETEGKKLLKKIPKNSFPIALDLKGKNFSSESFAEKIKSITLKGDSHLVFIIGGSMGLDKTVLNQCKLLLSFSAFTFPHQLMRVILLEQIYRAFKIIKHEPYHK